jgi:hypothetical protein
MGDNINAIKKYTITLLGAGKEVNLVINAENTKYVFIALHQTAKKIMV